MNLVCFDPALRTTGVALFRNGVLVDAYAVAPKVPLRGPMAWGRIAAAIWATVPEAAGVAVLEGQVVYPYTKADPNDILQVSGVAGGLAALAVAAGLDVVHYDPAAWKGQVPKKIVAERSQKRLTPAEMAAVRKGSTLDTWDAIGLGLHHLKR